MAEFEVERSAWTDREAMLTSGYHELEDIVDGSGGVGSKHLTLRPSRLPSRLDGQRDGL